MFIKTYSSHAFVMYYHLFPFLTLKVSRSCEQYRIQDCVLLMFLDFEMSRRVGYWRHINKVKINLHCHSLQSKIRGKVLI